MDLILKYFPELSGVQKQQFKALQELYEDWNLKINVIGNSFTISTKVKIAAAITDALTIGKVILNDVAIEEYPKLFDASKRFEGILEYPEVTPP